MACVDVERHAVVAAPIMLGINAHIIQYDMRLIALMMRGIGCECVVAALSHARHQWLNRFSFFPRELQAHAQCRRIAPVPDLCLTGRGAMEGLGDGKSGGVRAGSSCTGGFAGQHFRQGAGMRCALTQQQWVHSLPQVRMTLQASTQGHVHALGGQQLHWRVWGMAP
eukprot:scaffold319543_cov24-Tisochrysis_lutea.AAC.1